MKKLLPLLLAMLAFIGCSAPENSTETLGAQSQALNTCNPNYADSLPQTAGNSTVGAVATAAPWTAPGRINKLYAMGDGWDVTYTPVSGAPVTTHISFGAGVTCTHDQVGGWDMPSPSDNLRELWMWATNYSMVFAINGSSQPMNVFRCSGMQGDINHRNSVVRFSTVSTGTKISMIAPGPDPQSLVFSGVDSSGVLKTETVKFYGTCHLGDTTAPNYTIPNMDNTPEYLPGYVGVDDSNNAWFNVFGSAPISSVEFFVDGVSKGTDTTMDTSGGANPIYYWDRVVAGVSQGWHNLKAVATFPSGAKVWYEKKLFHSKRKVVSGANFNCFISDNNGTVKCWGKNSVGQLGNGATGGNGLREDILNWVEPGAQVQTPFYSTDQLAYATDVSAGLEAACAVVDGGVLCWGKNTNGILGVAPGSLASSNVPVQVIPANSNVLSVAVGGQHACALINNTVSVKCWGGGSYGQLGNGSFTATNITPASAGLTMAVKVQAARDSTFVLTAGGDVWTFGRDDYGQLGDTPGLVNKASPVKIIGASGASALTATASKLWGGWYHACASTSAGLKCWGSNTAGGLGNGVAGGVSALPVTATAWNMYPITEMALGDDSSCALLAGSGAACLGWNTYGAHGDGTTSPSLTPTTVIGSTGAVQMSHGFTHACFLKNTAAKCAGDNTNLQIGWVAPNPSTTPQ